MFCGKYRLSVCHSKVGSRRWSNRCFLRRANFFFFLVPLVAPDFTPRGQKLKSLPPLGHVHQLFQRYKEFLGIRCWRSSDLDTLSVRDSAMNSQTVASFVIPHISKPTSNPKRLASVVPANLDSIAYRYHCQEYIIISSRI